MRKKDKYKAIIVGAGRIAARFDSPKSERVMTHAHAYLKHRRVELAGFVDINMKAAAEAAKIWGGNSYDNFDEMFAREQPDIVSICVPDECHYEMLIKTAKHKPKMIICEKPITNNFQDTQKIIALLRKVNIPILINYSRRFDKSMRELKKNLSEEKYGRVLCANGIYTKGIIHNGVHMIDLARYLFGEVKKNLICYSVDDCVGNDKSVAGFLKFDKCDQFHLAAGDDRSFFIFELDIILEKKRIRLLNSDQYLYWQDVISDPAYPGCKCLSKPLIKKTSINGALTELINNAVAYLEKNTPLICDIDSAWQTEKTCFELLNKCK